MDPELVKEILDFKTHNWFPEGLTKHQRYGIKRRSSNFVLQDGVLYYICRRRQDKLEHLSKVVLTAKEANDIFVEFHCNAIGGHCGVDKTHNAVIQRYYWPGMEGDIRKWVAQCPDCHATRASLKEKTLYSPIQVNEPFELVGMDLMKLTTTEGGNQYICVMVDYFTKWAEAYPLKSKSAEEVTTCILDFVYKFGVPQRLLTDQGTEFKNQINSRLCTALGIQRSFCAPYHPQTNGLVEELNGTIQRSLNKLARHNPKKWDHHLESTMFALRTKKQLTTQYSPYYLMFGREARYPSEVAEEYEVTTEKVERLVQEERLFQGLLSQGSTYENVKKNVKKSQEKIVKRKLVTGFEDHFKVGDKVLKKNIREEQRKGGKMETDMLGPFKITQIEGKIVWLCTDTFKCIANVDQIVHFTEPEERVPAKLAKTDFPSDCPSAQLDRQNKKKSTCSPAGRSSDVQPNLSPAQTGAIHTVKTLWQSNKGEILWAKLGPYKIFTEDLRSLAPDNELESEIVNVYLWLVAQTREKVKVIDTFQMTAIWNDTSREMRKLDVSEWDILVGAVCKDRHWTLVAMYPSQGQAVFVDPFGATSTQIQHCKNKTRAFLRKKNLLISRWTCHTVSHPRQQDSTSCGVFVCKIAEQLLLGQQIDFEVNKYALDQLRLQMATKLIESSDNLMDLCHSCGERHTSDAVVDNWIECTICYKWFHWLCVGRPNTEDDYFCPACTE